MKNKKKIVELLKIIFLLVGFALLVLAFFQLLNSNFFRIKQAICFENHSSCQSNLWLKVNSLVLGQNVLFLSPQKISQQIKDELPKIEEAKVEKKLPDKLIIHLSKRKPIAVVEVGGEYWKVDYQGVVLARVNQPVDLPLVVSNELLTFSEGQWIDEPSILAGLDYLYKLLFNGIETRRVEVVNSKELIIHLKTGATVLVSIDTGRQQEVNSLQLILERTKIEGKKIEVIDMRFDKPVITYAD